MAGQPATASWRLRSTHPQNVQSCHRLMLAIATSAPQALGPSPQSTQKCWWVPLLRMQLPATTARARGRAAACRCRQRFVLDAHLAPLREASVPTLV